jgi:DNA-binding MarR family transcriptional regulator
MLHPYESEQALADAMLAFERRAVAMGLRPALTFDKRKRIADRPLTPQAMEILAYLRRVKDANVYEVVEATQLREFIAKNTLNALVHRNFVEMSRFSPNITYYRLKEQSE